MERNFTDERKNEVRQVMEASLLKWIQLDIQIDSNSELVSELGLDGATNYANVSELTGPDRYIREKVLVEYRLELAGEGNNAAGDVYGGVTNLVISGDGIYGHFPDDNDISSYRYWYYKDGKQTMNQSKELWAHYFACNMTGDKEAQESIRQYFPEASKVLDEIVTYMKEEANAQ